MKPGDDSLETTPRAPVAFAEQQTMVPDTLEAPSNMSPPAPTAPATVTPATRPTARRGSLGYEVGELLGRGGMGEVVLARDHDIGRNVAIKRLRGHDAPSAEAIERFVREAKIQARLDHPAIVPVYELGEDADGNPYFTMKRLTGTTLHQVLTRPPDSESRAIVGDPQQRALRAFVDVCLAIDFAHSRGVIHRDLKPANIMLGDFGEVYVIDWGIARAIDDPDEARRPSRVTIDDTTITQTGALLGTPGYMAPEQLRGDSTVGPAVDTYALGAILFEILTGEPLHPRGAGAIASTLGTVETSPAVRATFPIAPELDALCIAALASDPTKRPSVRHLAERVQRFLDGDRDVEQRRTLARAELEIARAAFDSGDPLRRAEAVKAAGRALALDPSSRDAARIVTSLMLEPPPVLPADLEDQLNRTERAIAANQARFAHFAILGYLTFVPLVIWVGVTDWWVLGGACVVIAGMAASAWVMMKRQVLWVDLAILGNIAWLTLLSRLFGPWVVVPGLAAGIAVMLQTAPHLTKGSLRVILGMCLAVVVPLALELLGILESTWSLVDGALVVRPTAMNLDGAPAVVLLAATNISMVVVMGLVSRASSLAWRTANRRVEIQQWHLQHLLPAEPPEPHRDI